MSYILSLKKRKDDNEKCLIQSWKSKKFNIAVWAFTLNIHFGNLMEQFSSVTMHTKLEPVAVIVMEYLDSPRDAHMDILKKGDKLHIRLTE